MVRRGGVVTQKSAEEIARREGALVTVDLAYQVVSNPKEIWRGIPGK